MKLVDEIIELAVDSKSPVSVLLRNCLVLAHRLDNKRLKRWVEKELDGYAQGDKLPEYRIVAAPARGTFFGPMGATIHDQPIPPIALKEAHRKFACIAELRQPIVSYDINSIPGGSQPDYGFRIDWPSDLVVLYQESFYQGDYALSRAWQNIPTSFMVALIDTIRNRVLKLALEIQEQLGLVSDDPAALPAAKLDQSVIFNIYGDHNVVAGYVSDIKQVDNIFINKGDSNALKKALKNLGADDNDLLQLDKALVEESASKKLGQKCLDWIQVQAGKLATKGADASIEVAKAEITKFFMQYWGLS